MGLRFRKSITLCKGLRLNFGMNGMSISAGQKGFRKTYNFGTGRTTTSVGIPGTGLSYVTTSNGNGRRRAGSTVNTFSQPSRRNTRDSYEDQYQEREPEVLPTNGDAEVIPDDAFLVREQPQPAEILNTDLLKSIHFNADSVVDWTETLIQDSPPESCEDESFWSYCHEKAYDVLNGNIDSYLQIIQDVGPLEDLLDYGFGFECGTDDPNGMVVEFHTKENEIMPAKSSMAKEEYNDLLQDYICSCSIRIARDIFSLLPVSYVIVHAVSNDLTILSVKFERRTFTKIKFVGADASDIVEQYRHNMVFNCNDGFSSVAQLEG